MAQLRKIISYLFARAADVRSALSLVPQNLRHKHSIIKALQLRTVSRNKIRVFYFRCDGHVSWTLASKCRRRIACVRTIKTGHENYSATKYLLVHEICIRNHLAFHFLFAMCSQCRYVTNYIYFCTRHKSTSCMSCHITYITKNNVFIGYFCLICVFLLQCLCWGFYGVLIVSILWW